MFYVGLKDEPFALSVYRYKRGGMFVPSTTKNAAHNAASYLFPSGARYNVLDVSGKVVAGGNTVGRSYWNEDLNQNIPNWLDLDAYERKNLNVNKDSGPYSGRNRA